MAFFFTGRRRRSAWMMRVVAAVFTTVIVSSNAASADRTFPVRQYEDGTIAIVSNHTQITGKRTAFRGDVWLSKINGGKGAYLMETFENTRKLNETLVSIKAQLRGGGCVGNNTKSALFNFTTHEYFNCTCKSGWGGEDCTVPNYSYLGEGECRQLNKLWIDVRQSVSYSRGVWLQNLCFWIIGHNPNVIWLRIGTLMSLNRRIHSRPTNGEVCK